MSYRRPTRWKTRDSEFSRDAVSRLPKRDQKFVNSYFERGHSHTPTEWKRFSRLTLKLRHLCQVSPKVGI